MCSEIIMYPLRFKKSGASTCMGEGNGRSTTKRKHVMMDSNLTSLCIVHGLKNDAKRATPFFQSNPLTSIQRHHCKMLCILLR